MTDESITAALRKLRVAAASSWQPGMMLHRLLMDACCHHIPTYRAAKNRLENGVGTFATVIMDAWSASRTDVSEMLAGIDHAIAGRELSWWKTGKQKKMKTA